MVERTVHRIPNYNAERALHHHENITDALTAKAAAGDLHLLTPKPVSDLSIFVGSPTLVVAPIEPIHTAAEMDEFRQNLLPNITPDISTNSTGSHRDKNGGLHFGSLGYDNVPGYTMHMVKVEKCTSSSRLANPQALTELSAKTGKRPEELVRTTWVHVFPEKTLANFMMDYALRVQKGEDPYNPLLLKVASGLSNRQLAVLKEDPSRLVDWLTKQVEKARDYTGVPSNLALAEI